MATYSHVSFVTDLTIEQQQSQMDVLPGGLPAMNNIVDYMTGLIGGNQAATVSVTVGRLFSAGTLTFSSVVATNTFSVNGVTFTAIASGATGNQFNVGVSDTLTAANAAAAVNASVTALIPGYVTASSALGVLTITASQSGTMGNAITIASGSGTIVASGARLTGGSNGTVTAIPMGR